MIIISTLQMRKPRLRVRNLLKWWDWDWNPRLASDP